MVSRQHIEEHRLKRLPLSSKTPGT
jgi:hypothetical protein